MALFALVAYMDTCLVLCFLQWDSWDTAKRLCSVQQHIYKVKGNNDNDFYNMGIFQLLPVQYPDNTNLLLHKDSRLQLTMT